MPEITPIAANIDWSTLRAGDVIRARHNAGGWIESTVVNIDKDLGQVHIELGNLGLIVEKWNFDLLQHRPLPTKMGSYIWVDECEFAEKCPAFLTLDNGYWGLLCDDGQIIWVPAEEITAWRPLKPLEPQD